MLVCLSCPKHSNLSAAHSPLHPDAIASPRPYPRREAHIKTFTAQLKDRMMKFSGACRHCRLCTTHHDDHDQPDASRSSTDASDAAAATSSRFSPTHVHQFGELSPTPYDHLLPTAPRRPARRRSKNSVFPATPTRSNSRSSRHSRDTETENAHREEWVAQVEPGVLITFVALPDGSNDLKRIRFSRELFSKWHAQLWWTENCEMVHELYSVSRSLTEVCDSGSPVSSCASSGQDEEDEALRNTPETVSTIDSAHTSPSRINDCFFVPSSVSSSNAQSSIPCSHLSAAAPLLSNSIIGAADKTGQEVRESGYEGSFSCSSS